MTLAGKPPDPWQKTLLRSSASKFLVLASRQTGKSILASSLALKEAFLNPGSLVLILSRSQRQSSELFRAKIMPMFNALGRPFGAINESALQITLGNGSRIISLPGKSDETILGYSSVNLMVIDEAARVPDALYFAVRPMLAVSKGKLICLSSAYARQGFFYEAWIKETAQWERAKVKGSECHRIGEEFLREELDNMGQRLFEREYCCVFSSADDAVFDADMLEKICSVPVTEKAMF